MVYLPKLFSVIFLILATWMGWAAFQMKFKNRIELLGLGTRPLPGADRLKTQFASIFLFQSLTCVATAMSLLILDALQPTIWVYLVVSFVLSMRRAVLIRGLEIYATKSSSEA